MWWWYLNWSYNLELTTYIIKSDNYSHIVAWIVKICFRICFVSLQAVRAGCSTRRLTRQPITVKEFEIQILNSFLNVDYWIILQSSRLMLISSEPWTGSHLWFCFKMKRVWSNFKNCSNYQNLLMTSKSLWGN